VAEETKEISEPPKRSPSRGLPRRVPPPPKKRATDALPASWRRPAEEVVEPVVAADRSWVIAVLLGLLGLSVVVALIWQAGQDDRPVPPVRVEPGAPAGRNPQEPVAPRPRAGAAVPSSTPSAVSAPAPMPPLTPGVVSPPAPASPPLSTSTPPPAPTSLKPAAKDDEKLDAVPPPAVPKP
jgi:hypothetical protein